MEQTDEELVLECLAGSEDAFSILVQRHLKSVYSFALRSVGDEADDIAQESFMKAWKSLEKYDPSQAQFKTWLMRIARNAVFDYLRKKKPFVFSDIENTQGESAVLDTRDTEPLPDELVARAHDEREVREVLEKLPSTYREVLLLRYMNQLSFEEIGRVLDEPSNTVRSRHRRGLIKLRELLEALHQREI